MNKLCTLLFTAFACHGATISIAFTTQAFNGLPGTQLVLDASLANTTPNTVFLNGASVTLDGFPSGSVDSSPFLINAPWPSFDPLGVSGPFAFLVVTIPQNQAPGLYSGIFTVQGGADDQTFDDLGNASFTVSVVPEPPSALLLLPALACIVRWPKHAIARSSAHHASVAPVARR